MGLSPDVLRYAAFTTDPAGGNPAGVVLDAAGLDAAAMQAIAADVGYSETAFVTDAGDGAYDVRYFAPTSEVPFCGHATIATAVALAERGAPQRLVFRTQAGEVTVTTAVVDGQSTATLISVAPYVELVEDATVVETLDSLGWTLGDLDPALPPLTAFAGARHLVLAVSTRERLASLDYDFDRLLAVMQVTAGQPCSWCGARTPRPIMYGTRSPSAAWSRTPRRARLLLRTAPTCAPSAPLSCRRP